MFYRSIARLLRKGALHLTNIVLSIQNRLLSEAICSSLKKTGDFRPTELPFAKPSDTVKNALPLHPDIILMETSKAPGGTLEDRLATAGELRTKLPSCRIVLICDERANPEIARGVMMARQDGRIDHFFYTSVTSEYLVDSLTSLQGDIRRKGAGLMA